ncbi:hypothetical protein [Rickettsia endosymbiont of Pantilius tunicatus]
MEKGIIHHQYGINGVKFIEEKAVEVKIRADKRLLAREIYERKKAINKF